jgi:hypothetical protein
MQLWLLFEARRLNVHDSNNGAYSRLGANHLHHEEIVAYEYSSTIGTTINSESSSCRQ